MRAAPGRPRTRLHQEAARIRGRSLTNGTKGHEPHNRHQIEGHDPREVEPERAHEIKRNEGREVEHPR